MRAFLALAIPEEVTDALVRLQSAIPFGKAVPEENLHLTLAFLGDAPEEALEDLHGMLEAMRTGPVDIRFTALDSFTEMERGLVFAAVDRTEALQALHDRVAALCRSAGLELPRRRFRPHVTLMRANRRPAGPTRDRLAAMMGPLPDMPGFTARALTLYQSTLTPRGAVHEPLARYLLAG
ncbi:RNA 2',3'-cyclic phosphodiesterase [Rhodobacterales bacterium HKCCSP123]|nr:RNA 2',3'-cyclic phosphodiesterase [Rhodobacterales bacterium HKCCSP123]